MKKNLSIFCLSLSVLLWATAAQALSTFYIAPDQAMGMVGKSGVIMEVQSSTVKSATMPNGWQANRCEFTGVVYKGNDEYSAKEEIQTVVVHMIPAGRIRGLRSCSAGMKGIYSIYGKSSMGFSSVVGNDSGSIPFEKSQDGKLYTRQRDLNIRDKSLSSKFLKVHPQVSQSLTRIKTYRATPGTKITPPRASAEEARALTKFLAQQYWPNQALQNK